MSETYQHTNRMGDVYHLQSKPGKSGRPQYSFARKPTGSPVQDLPPGYEVRELPDSGQVMIRRTRPCAIHPEEKRLLERVIGEQTERLLCIVDMEDRSLVVYTSDMDADARLSLLGHVMPMDPVIMEQMRSRMLAFARYSKMMRFTLIDAETRRFNLERWCFRGSIDDWVFIDGDSPLAALAKKYVKHLDKESFFDLM